MTYLSTECTAKFVWGEQKRMQGKEVRNISKTSIFSEVVTLQAKMEMDIERGILGSMKLTQILKLILAK